MNERVIFSRPKLEELSVELGDLPIELGRQQVEQKTLQPCEPEPFSVVSGKHAVRVICAEMSETGFSRTHARILRLDSDLLRITNCSRNQVVRVNSHNVEIQPGESNDFRVFGLQLQINDLTVRIGTTESEDIRVLTKSLRDASMSVADLSASQGLQVSDLVHWIHQTVEVLELAAESRDLIPEAMARIAEMFHFDRLLYFDGQPTSPEPEDALYSHQSNSQHQRTNRPLSRRLLQMAAERRSTAWREPRKNEEAESLAGLEAAVAAPLLSPNDEVIGLLYGEWQAHSVYSPSKDHADLFTLLAHCLRVGLLREHHEGEAYAGEQRIKEQQALFGQFFDPQLAKRVLTDPSLLDAKNQQITVMFCDIVAFSQVTERLPVDLSLKWLRSVLSEVSACIVAEGGVLVDFVGDAVMAIWGAPEAQKDHAVRGCRASRAIISRVEVISRKWEDQIGTSTEVMLGLNSGTANVGNVGSQQKFKYGALGNTVNLASRIQGVAKKFGIAVAMGQSTRDELDGSVEISRLSKVRVVNIQEPLELFELVVDNFGASSPARTQYQAGLAAFESSEFSLATKHLASVVNDFPDYAPAKMLLLRAVDALTNGEPDHHPVWVLDEK